MAMFVLQLRSSDNFADLFTKALTTATFKKLVHLIRLSHLRDLDVCTHEGKSLRAVLFFLNHGFNEAASYAHNGHQGEVL